MPSASLQRWRNERCAALDEIEEAHKAIGGTGPGRRHATQELNYAYAMLLSSQFQAYCRDLHSECADLMVQSVATPALRRTFREALVRHRKLDHGNPNPGNLGADFDLFGFRFWDAVKLQDLRNRSRQTLLEAMNESRNAIAHRNFTKLHEGEKLPLHRVKAWRAACNQLATAFDAALYQHLRSMGISLG